MNLYTLGRRFLEVKETPGAGATPMILVMLQTCDPKASSDEIAWCSAFPNFLCWLLNWPRSRSLAARSWLAVGQPIVLTVTDTQRGDIVILQRGVGPQPGPEVLNAPGHVGILDRYDGTFVWLLSGNEHNAVTIAPFSKQRVLGVRRVSGPV